MNIEGGSSRLYSYDPSKIILGRLGFRPVSDHTHSNEHTFDRGNPIHNDPTTPTLSYPNLVAVHKFDVNSVTRHSINSTFVVLPILPAREDSNTS